MAACGQRARPQPPSGDPGPGDADVAPGDELFVPAELPDEAWLVWSSNREETRQEIYLRNAHGGAVTRLTHGGGQAPRWSPDGRWIAYWHFGERRVRLVRWDGTGDKLACESVTQTGGPPQSWRLTDGRLICPTSGVADPPGRGVVFFAVDPDTDERTELFSQADFDHVANARFDPSAFSHDGAWLLGWTHGLFDGGYQATNGTFDSFHATVLLRPSDPTVIYWVGPGCLSAAPPHGPWVYHVTRESETLPDIFRLRLDDLDERASYGVEIAHVDTDWGHEYMPSVSNDGDWLVYGASLGCHDWYACDYDIFLHQLGAPPDRRERLVEDPANDSFPSLFVGPLPDIP